MHTHTHHICKKERVGELGMVLISLILILKKLWQELEANLGYSETQPRSSRRRGWRMWLWPFGTAFTIVLHEFAGSSRHIAENEDAQTPSLMGGFLVDEAHFYQPEK